jgi:hypothetical protein
MSLGPGFYTKLIQMSSELGLNPEDVLAMMEIESGLNPHVSSKMSEKVGTAGLTQLIPSVRRQVGFTGTRDEFMALSGEDQLPYIKRYFEKMVQQNGGPFKSAAQMYVANLWPIALSYPRVRANDPNAIVISSHPAPGGKVPIDFEIKAYYGNKGLDVDNDGNITLGDLSKVIQRAKGYRSYKDAVVQLRATPGIDLTNKMPIAQNDNDDVISRIDHFLDQLLLAVAEQNIPPILKQSAKK